MQITNMTDESREQLSAWVDGELADDQARFLLRRLQSDSELRGTCDRYALIHSCLKREPFLPADGFADRMSAALAAEAPLRRGAAHFWRPLLGAAIAAGVAAIALFSAPAPAPVPGAVPGTADAGVASVPTAPRELAGGVPLRTSDLTPTLRMQPVADRWTAQPVPLAATPLDPRIEGYLLRHGQATLGSVRGGLVPFVYIVATPAREPDALAPKEKAAQ